MRKHPIDPRSYIVKMQVPHSLMILFLFKMLSITSTTEIVRGALMSLKIKDT